MRSTATVSIAGGAMFRVENYQILGVGSTFYPFTGANLIHFVFVTGEIYLLLRIYYFQFVML